MLEPQILQQLLPVFVLWPLAGFLISMFLPKSSERVLSFVSAAAVGFQTLGVISFTLIWLIQQHPSLFLEGPMLYQSSHYFFRLDLYFDKITATYALVGSSLSFLVVMYSRYYLHREEGYKRFFNTILLFFSGYNIIVFSGNFETLFIGWEVLGISSFLLIAFYRDRFLPVRNAVKVFSIYRIGDIGLLLAMWMSHHFWANNISFRDLNNYILVDFQIHHSSLVGYLISILILIAAAAKSAQLPFSSWLPRAMEGPTPSSAIFYGSLSVHIGVFMLLRTFTFWEHQPGVRIAICLLGFFTMLIATGISRVQSSIKSQIAYASIAQIGIIFIEVALGFEKLALFHFAGNAFLRTYQLLVSPSVVSYLIREQFYNYSPHLRSIEASFPAKFRNTLYILCLKEWNLDSFLYEAIWNPIKKLARLVPFVNARNVLFIFVPAFLLGLYGLYHKDSLPVEVQKYLPLVFAFIGLIMVLKSFAERRELLYTWQLIIMSHFWISLAIGFNEEFDYNEIYLYLSGVVVSGLVGFLILRKIRRIEPGIDLSEFHGHVYEHPKMALIFLLACLGLTGFPITPTFIGEDLLFAHIKEDQILLAFFVSMSFVVDGLSIIRVYARIFLGPHVKTYHEVAYRSS